ncbi:DUF6179 domain-containing protein [Clostridium sp. 1001271B_151109_B4]|uniref:DUF6179 domain-containing protein n=1 Tax=Clostridium sp. 1001271B_151109_B4 TaxID=2787148 RepID=UPI0018A8D5CD|nr:DUF6179 domain-containing protein [Clostridium sp. 1001271B_151109_B4]
MAENNSYLEFLNNSNLANISNEEKEIMQIKLWTLLGKVTERYTMGDSSSVPVEIAEELLKSITFLLNKEMKNSQSIVKLFESESLESAWKDSWATIEKDIAKGKELLEEVMKTSTGIENISYEDTVVEIEKGIKVYDYRFFAHEIPCSIDYQLSNAVSEDLQGIDFINEYLTRLLFENKFCNNFEKEKIIEILKSYCKDYKGLLINIFEPVLTNVIGLDLVEADIFKLEIKSYEREVVLYTFKNMTIKEIEEELIKSANSVCNKLKIVSDFEINYVKMTALNLLPRIEEGIKNNNLENIFLSYKIEEDKSEDIFVDNKAMDDERLRKLIDEIRVCRFTKDKIAIIHNEVKSLEDLVEILNNCIWEDEVEELVNSLSKEEIRALKYYLNNKLNDNISNTGWEQKFIEVISRF